MSQFQVYPDPTTSHVAAEFQTLAEALEYPATKGAEIIRNGMIFATVSKKGQWVRFPVDVKKLSEDLQTAHIMAELAVEGVEDSGTWNFEAVTLFFEQDTLPALRIRIECAVQAVGLRWFWQENTEAGQRCLGVNPNVRGQAKRRTIAAQTMTNALRTLGWDVLSQGD